MIRADREALVLAAQHRAALARTRAALVSLEATLAQVQREHAADPVRASTVAAVSQLWDLRCAVAWARGYRAHLERELAEVVGYLSDVFEPAEV